MVATFQALCLFSAVQAVRAVHYLNLKVDECSLDVGGTLSEDVDAAELADWLKDHEFRLQKDAAQSDDYLLNNAKYALEARRWITAAKKVPDSIFKQFVLPYRQVDEPVDNWRAGFFTVFFPAVKDMTSLRQVAEHVIPRVWRELRNSSDVMAHTNNSAVVFKSSQTPQVMAPVSETLKVGYASCTGCSILAADALRAVGVPARVVGTPEWNVTDGGNHNWIEVWTGEGNDDGWEFCEPDPGADKVTWNDAWFLHNNTKYAVPNDSRHGIFTPVWVPSCGDSTYEFTWRSPAQGWPAIDRTAFYKSL